MKKDLIDFPSGKYFTLTWSINESHGGMTKALLHRARAFLYEAKIPTTIITFNWRRSYDPVISALKKKDVIIQGMFFKNFWDDILSVNVNALPIEINKEINMKHFSPKFIEEKKGRSKTRFLDKKDNDDFIRQKEYYRTDGSLCILEYSGENDKDDNGVVYLCDDDGKPIQSFSKIEDIFFLWLDFLVGGETAFFTIDSKFTANVFVDYQRNNVIKTYVTHGSHISTKYDSPYSTLTLSRKKIFLNMQAYDAISVLTERQKNEIRTSLGDLGNIYAIPNSHRYKYVPSLAKIKKRSNTTGVILASLSVRKQLDHAIHAIAGVVKEHKELHFNVFSYGTGDQEKNLNNLVNDLGIPDVFLFKGYTDDSINAFKQASFSLLTSSAEGFPLVLIESMASGCIPISYDMRYGPSQIIEHGVDGFLVKFNDIDGLKKCIAKFLKLSESEKEKMRGAALQKAATLRDSSVVPMWADLYKRSLIRKNRQFFPINSKEYSASLSVISFYDGGLNLSCIISNKSSDSQFILYADAILISFRPRRGEEFFRSNVEKIERQENNNFIVQVSFPIEAIQYLRNSLTDAFVEVYYGNELYLIRISTFNMQHLHIPYATVHGNLSIDKRRLEEVE